MSHRHFASHYLSNRSQAIWLQAGRERNNFIQLFGSSLDFLRWLPPCFHSKPPKRWYGLLHLPPPRKPPCTTGNIHKVIPTFRVNLDITIYQRAWFHEPVTVHIWSLSDVIRVEYWTHTYCYYWIISLNL